MLTLADFAFEVLASIEILAQEGKGLPRAAVRQAMTRFVPLGTTTADLDDASAKVCDAVLYTGLVIEINNVLLWRASVMPAAPRDTAELN